MTYMPCRSSAGTAPRLNLLIVAAFGVTATFVMLLLDRYLGFPFFFTTDMGGNAMIT